MRSDETGRDEKTNSEKMKERKGKKRFNGWERRVCSFVESRNRNARA